MRLLSHFEYTQVTGAAANFGSVQDCCWVGLGFGLSAGIPAMCAATMGPVGMIAAGAIGGYASARMFGAQYGNLGGFAGASAGAMGFGVLALANTGEGLGSAIMCGATVGAVVATNIYGAIYG